MTLSQDENASVSQTRGHGFALQANQWLFPTRLPLYLIAWALPVSISPWKCFTVFTDDGRRALWRRKVVQISSHVFLFLISPSAGRLPLFIKQGWSLYFPETREILTQLTRLSLFSSTYGKQKHIMALPISEAKNIRINFWYLTT